LNAKLKKYNQEPKKTDMSLMVFQLIAGCSYFSDLNYYFAEILNRYLVVITKHLIK